MSKEITEAQRKSLQFQADVQILSDRKHPFLHHDHIVVENTLPPLKKEISSNPSRLNSIPQPPISIVTRVQARHKIQSGGLVLSAPTLLYAEFTPERSTVDVFLELTNQVIKCGITGKPKLDTNTSNKKHQKSKTQSKTFEIVDESTQTSTNKFYSELKAGEVIEILSCKFLTDYKMFTNYPLPPHWMVDQLVVKKIKKFAKALGVTYSSLLNVLRIIRCHALPVISSVLHKKRGYGLYAVSSLVNHSCKPNTIFCTLPGNELTKGVSGNLHLYALRDISPGEEITIHSSQYALFEYFDDYLPIDVISNQSKTKEVTTWPWSNHCDCLCMYCVARSKSWKSLIMKDHDSNTDNCESCITLRNLIQHHFGREFQQIPNIYEGILDEKFITVNNKEVKESEYFHPLVVIEDSNKLVRENRFGDACNRLLDWRDHEVSKLNNLLSQLDNKQTQQEVDKLMKQIEAHHELVTKLSVTIAPSLSRMIWPIFQGARLALDENEIKLVASKLDSNKCNAEQDNEDSDEERKRINWEKRDTNTSKRATTRNENKKKASKDSKRARMQAKMKANVVLSSIKSTETSKNSNESSLTNTDSVSKEVNSTNITLDSEKPKETLYESVFPQKSYDALQRILNFFYRLRTWQLEEINKVLPETEKPSEMKSSSQFGGDRNVMKFLTNIYYNVIEMMAFFCILYCDAKRFDYDMTCFALKDSSNPSTERKTLSDVIHYTSSHSVYGNVNQFSLRVSEVERVVMMPITDAFFMLDCGVSSDFQTVWMIMLAIANRLSTSQLAKAREALKTTETPSSTPEDSQTKAKKEEREIEIASWRFVKTVQQIGQGELKQMMSDSCKHVKSSHASFESKFNVGKETEVMDLEMYENKTENIDYVVVGYYPHDKEPRKLEWKEQGMNPVNLWTCSFPNQVRVYKVNVKPRHPEQIAAMQEYERKISEHQNKLATLKPEEKLEEKVEGNVEIVLSEKLEARKVNVGEHVNEDTESVDSVIVHQDRGTEYEYDNDYRDIDGEYDNNKKDEEEQEEEVEA